MAEIVWDSPGSRKFETGVSKGILFLKGDDGAYLPGIPWNGIISVSETPQGGDSSRLYADDMLYASIQSITSYKATLEAYAYPEEFNECFGYAVPTAGFMVHQGKHRKCALCWQSMQGDEAFQSTGRKLHIAYGLSVGINDIEYQTFSDSPDATVFSWDLEGTNVQVFNCSPTAKLVVDLSRLTHNQVSVLEDLLYSETGAVLPLPNDILSLFSATGLFNFPSRQHAYAEIDFLSGNTLYRGVRTSAIMIEDPADLADLALAYPPGSIAYISDFSKIWMMAPNREWVRFTISQHGGIEL